MSLGLLPLAIVYDLTGKTDVVLLFGFVILRNWKLAIGILQSDSLRSLFGIMIGAASVFGLAQLIQRWKKRPARRDTLSREGPKPLFFPSRTTHTRLFPKKHSFSYSYLLVGIPIGWKGSVGDILAADQGHGNVTDDIQAGYVGGFFYSVDAADYLERGNAHTGLDGKLKKYLESQVCKFRHVLHVLPLMQNRVLIRWSIRLHISLPRQSYLVTLLTPCLSGIFIRQIEN